MRLYMQSADCGSEGEFRVAERGREDYVGIYVGSLL